MLGTTPSCIFRRFVIKSTSWLFQAEITGILFTMTKSINCYIFNYMDKENQTAKNCTDVKAEGKTKIAGNPAVEHQPAAGEKRIQPSIPSGCLYPICSI